jgi:hypothetical protein
MSAMLDILTKNGDTMNQVKATENGYQSRIWTGTVRLFCWSAAWVAATAFLKFGPKFLWNQTPALTLLAAAFNLAVGIGLILANKNYITELDELQQKVYLNALGITVGVGLIAGVPYAVLDSYNLVPFHADISHLLMVMSVTFVASNVYGNLRYR